MPFARARRYRATQPNPTSSPSSGFEWTQVGRTPDEHFGHKNVIFRDLEDEKVSKRAIAALGRQSSRSLSIANNMSPLVPLRDFQHRQRYFDYNRFISDTREAEMCPTSTGTRQSCLKAAWNMQRPPATSRALRRAEAPTTHHSARHDLGLLHARRHHSTRRSTPRTARRISA